MNGSMYFFLSMRALPLFGHIGWGFFHSDGRYYFGSTDHYWRGNANWNNWNDLLVLAANAFVPPGQNNDGWVACADSEAEMLTAMKNGYVDDQGHHRIAYERYKMLSVPNANPDDALKQGRDNENRGWIIVTNNCLDHVGDVAWRYGLAWNTPNPFEPHGPLPLKQNNWAPFSWFNALPAPDFPGDGKPL